MGLEDNILKKTLQDLDGQDWGEPTYPSHLVTECHRLRRVPLERLDVENLRLLIGQSLSLEYLLPLAFAHLQRNPWIDGDYYEGDLLQSVIGVPDSFWHSHPELKQQLDQIVEKALDEGPGSKLKELQDVGIADRSLLRKLKNWQLLSQS